MKAITIFWFRRDLRLNDNRGLFECLKNKDNVRPIFIFDTGILQALGDPEDKRVNFIHQSLLVIKNQLTTYGSDLFVYYGIPLEIFKKITLEHTVEAVYTNHDYEPSTIERDFQVMEFLKTRGVSFNSFKDQVIFEKSEILNDSGKPYLVFTPYKKKWLKTFLEEKTNITPLEINQYQDHFKHFEKVTKPQEILNLEDIAFKKIQFDFPQRVIPIKTLKNYQAQRDFPAIEGGTSHLGIHLRFGTVSVRKLVLIAWKESETWLSELIWREFFMQILWHFPQVARSSFKPQYDRIAWRNHSEDLDRWKLGQTGYPIIDAGMRELKSTGYMHNRVRMIVGSFLTKNLLMHWTHGEKHFANLLLDYDLAANSGNWQWVAGCGCDAAPFFRIFNPSIQAKKFDPDDAYILKWVPEFNTSRYTRTMVDFKSSRERALAEFKKIASHHTYL